jgi:uncharacterized protein YndB with AHSA1/START domain
MQTIEQMKADQAKALAKLEREIAIANACPLPPKRVQDTALGAPWITYECTSLADALHIMSAFQIIPAWQYKGTFTRFQPESLANEKSGEVTSGPFAASIHTTQGREYGPDAQLRFFATVQDKPAHIHVGLNRFREGGSYGARAIYASPNSRHETGRIERWEPNVRLSAQSDKLTRWGTGSKDSAIFEYHFQADETDGGSEHATAMLWGIVEQQRKCAFETWPMLEGFLSTLLEDLQMSEAEEAFGDEREERDCGTIYTCPESTLRAVAQYCRDFRDAARKVIEDNRLDETRIGADLYLAMAGHGADFRDRNDWVDDVEESRLIGNHLHSYVSGRIETYIGDDSRAYIVGKESI